MTLTLSDRCAISACSPDSRFSTLTDTSSSGDSNYNGLTVWVSRRRIRKSSPRTELERARSVRSPAATSQCDPAFADAWRMPSDLVRHHPGQLSFFIRRQNQPGVHVKEPARQGESIDLFRIDHF